MQLLQLTADKIIDLSRLVAVLPDKDRENYSLIMEGSDRSISVDRQDVSIISKYLDNKNTDVQTKYNLTDLAKPQAVEVLQARIAKYSLMSDAESAAKASAWERFKQDIDAERPDDCKLYS